MFHLPKHFWEWPIFLTFWFGGLFTLFYEVHIVLKTYYPEWWDEPKVQIHFLCAFFLAFNIYFNMVMLLMSNVIFEGAVTDLNEQKKADGWKFCEKCSTFAPPRSHHCKLCNRCILKRDHHCWFTAYCIGYQNQRYYVCMMFFCCIAAVYCNLFNWEFVLNVKGGFAWTTIPSFLAPHFGLVLGYYTLYEFAITAVTSVGILFTFLFFWLFIIQCQQIMSGQVKYERKKGILDYSLGVKNTISEIFGSAGFLVFLSPFIPSKLPGDGTSFPRQSEKTK